MEQVSSRNLPCLAHFKNLNVKYVLKNALYFSKRKFIIPRDRCRSSRKIKKFHLVYQKNFSKPIAKSHFELS